MNEGKQNITVQQVVDEVAVRICAAGGATQLLQGIDPLKDQSYFLAAVPAAALAACAFPLGSMHKEEVRRAAAAAGSPSATRRSSAGICFIGWLFCNSKSQACDMATPSHAAGCSRQQRRRLRDCCVGGGIAACAISCQLISVCHGHEHTCSPSDDDAEVKEVHTEIC